MWIRDGTSGCATVIALLLRLCGWIDRAHTRQNDGLDYGGLQLRHYAVGTVWVDSLRQTGGCCARAWAYGAMCWHREGGHEGGRS